MSKFEKLVLKLLSGQSDKNFHFDDLVKLLLSFGFQLRVNGTSHHIFTKPDIAEIINIQPINNKAKPYQVKQVRELIIRYKLWSDESESE